MTSMTPGFDRTRPRVRTAAGALLAALVMLTAGCPGRRPTRPLAPLVVPTPTPTPIPEPGPPSLAPPAPAESLPADPPRHLVAAARMAERARAELAAGRVDRALEVLEQAVQVDPDAPFAYYYLAKAYLARDRDQEAIIFAQRAASLSLGYPAGWEGHSQVLQGLAFEKLGHRDIAIRAYRAALVVDPENAPAQEALTRLRP